MTLLSEIVKYDTTVIAFGVRLNVSFGDTNLKSRQTGKSRKYKGR